MKLTSTLLSAVLLALSATTSSAFAVDEHHTEAKAEKAEAAKSETGEVKKPAKKKVKKHNHMEEKMAMPMSEPSSDMNKQEMMKDMSKHDHTKDKH